MTEKLYYNNQYMKEFNATITNKRKCGRGWEIVLDKTAFYPEGGGQPADKGELDGIPVLDVKKVDGEVYHQVPELPEGDVIKGVVDWPHRFDYMQQHTGQHILSAVLKHIVNGATVAVGQGGDYTSIEIDLDNISREELNMVEEAANAIICFNIPLYTYFNGETPISSFPLRRETKFTQDVRLVQIGGESLEGLSSGKLSQLTSELTNNTDIYGTDTLIDLAACGGVHTSTTGEVGLIKYKGQEKVRGRVRLYWIIGKRAYDDYASKTMITNKLSEALSTPLGGISEEFDRILLSLNEEKRKNNDLLDEMTELKVKEILENCSKGTNTILFKNMDSQFFKKIVVNLSSIPELTVCLLNQNGDEGQWALISTGNDRINFNNFRRNLLPIIQGKGGGKAPLWQGKIEDCSSIALFRETFSRLF